MSSSSLLTEQELRLLLLTVQPEDLLTRKMCDAPQYLRGLARNTLQRGAWESQEIEERLLAIMNYRNNMSLAYAGQLADVCIHLVRRDLLSDEKNHAPAARRIIAGTTHQDVPDLEYATNYLGEYDAKRLTVAGCFDVDKYMEAEDDFERSYQILDLLYTTIDSLIRPGERDSDGARITRSKVHLRILDLCLNPLPTLRSSRAERVLRWSQATQSRR